MKREDFTYQYSPNGYTIFYKGVSIGGAGVMLPRAKPLHWKHSRANLKQFSEEAKYDIDRIISGTGQKRFYDAIEKISKQKSNPKKSKYYIYGVESGKGAAHDTDWQPGEMLEKYEQDDLGEVAGQILENWQQMAGTIYYEGVSDSSLDKFEEGFYEGFSKEVEGILREEGKI